MHAEPHVVMRAKRIFQRSWPGNRGEIMIGDAPGVATDLLWFMTRYKLEMSLADLHYLQDRHAEHLKATVAVERIISGDYEPSKLEEPARPARQYQLDAVEVLLATGSNLVVHAAGLGKTATALYALGDPRLRPAVYVTLTHLPHQVLEQLTETYPDMVGHALSNGPVYDISAKLGRDPDLIVMSYSKLSKWANHLAEVCKYVIFDEIQELRHSGTQKYAGAMTIRNKVSYCMGTTATPVYGYGGEMFDIVEVIEPGFLGERNEFLREWSGVYVGAAGNIRLGDPGALGAHLRAEGIMEVKTRKDVGREIPEPIVVKQEVECDAEVLEHAVRDVRDIASEFIAGGQKGIDRMQMASQLDMKIRWATGVGKAHHVAEFVKLLLESEEKVLLFGWHRDVYDIWLRELAAYAPVLYTGSESPKQKADAKTRFMSTGYQDSARVMMMSLRAGAGIDGLQKVCSAVVFGELDWSPQVHRQNVWRIDRDGQENPVAAFYCVSDGGTDPLMEETLELKRQQSGALVSKDDDAELFNVTPTDEGRIRRLAEQIVSQ